MALISILFCLALQRFANVGGWFQPTWFEAYLKALSPWLAKLDEKFALFLVITPILLLFVLLHLIFKWHFFGLFDLIISTATLFFCIDARDLKNRLIPYFDSLDKADNNTATSAVSDLINDDSIGNITDLSRAVSRAILLKSFERIFAGLFWFMIFGVYGVVCYSSLTLVRQNALKVNPNYIELAKLAAKIQNILEWLPARLLGFSYALVGNFNKGFGYCSKHILTSLSEVKKFAVESGLAALDVSPNVGDADQNENRAALDIINRVLIVWLVGMLLVFAGVLL